MGNKADALHWYQEAGKYKVELEKRGARDSLPEEEYEKAVTFFKNLRQDKSVDESKRSLAKLCLEQMHQDSDNSLEAIRMHEQARMDSAELVSAKANYALAHVYLQEKEYYCLL